MTKSNQFTERPARAKVRTVRATHRRRDALATVAIMSCCLMMTGAPAGAGTVVPARAPANARPDTATAPANDNFQGDWTGGLDNNPDETATIEVDHEDLTTGSFTGTVIPPEDLGDLSEDFDILDGQVTGDHVTFEIQRYDVGPDDSTFTGDWSATISGDKLVGDLSVTLDPVPENCQDDGGDSVIPADDDNCFVGGPFTASHEMTELSGTVTSGCHSSGTCSATGEPVADVVVNVDGDYGTAQDTTDEDGKWDVEVPEDGKYTVKPDGDADDLDVDPAKIDVTADEDHSDEDFKVCGATYPDDAPTPELGSSLGHPTLATSAAGSLTVLKGTGSCYGDKVTVAFNLSNGSWAFSWLSKEAVGDGVGKDAWPHPHLYTSNNPASLGSLDPNWVVKQLHAASTSGLHVNNRTGVVTVIFDVGSATTVKPVLKMVTDASEHRGTVTLYGGALTETSDYGEIAPLSVVIPVSDAGSI